MRATKAIGTGLIVIGAVLAMGAGGCKNGGGKGKSAAAEWIEHPKPGTKDGAVLKFEDLGVQFERPETLYVFKTCDEASHSPDGANKWIPVVTCRSGSAGAFSSDSEESEDPFAEEEVDGAEAIDLTFYVTEKTRPLDERALAWFENNYKQAGLHVEDISYQHDYQKKSGIYAKLHVMDKDSGTPTREIVQFMFPREDVVFVARMEYPFGESRSVDQDWTRLLWNFDWMAGVSQ
jgi:hypothetical protein